MAAGDTTPVATPQRVYEFLLALHRNGGNVTRTAREFDIHRNTGADWRDNLGKRLGVVDENGNPRPPAAGAEVEIDKLRIRVADLERQLREARADRVDDDFIRSTVFGLAQRQAEPPDWVVDTSHVARGEEVPVLLWSDWHLGETVNREEVAGVNEFNRTIAEARVKRLLGATIDLCFNHRPEPKFPGVVVCIAGDMITGDIHEELRLTNDMTPQESVLLLRDVLVWALDLLAKNFGRVFAVFVPGNHGRGTLRPMFKRHVRTSHEWLAMQMVERHFAADQRFTFLVPPEADAYFRVYNHRFFLTHGDMIGVKGGDGIIGSLGPIMRGSFKLRNSESQIGRQFDTLLMGHWHNYIALRGLVVNGSLIGYNEYARKQLRAVWQPPIQALMFVHPRRGLIDVKDIVLDDQVVGETSPWISWHG